MSRALYAPSSWILALWGLLYGGWTPSAEGGEGTPRVCAILQEAGGANILEKPLKSSIRLRVGAEVVTVVIEGWNAEGLLESQGVLAWEHIQYDSLERVFRKVMDRDSSHDWILLGELQLAHPNSRGGLRSTHSFEAALALAPSAAAEVAAARERGQRRRAAFLAGVLRSQEEANQARRIPGRSGWWPLPWPAETPQTRSQSIARQKADTAHLLRQSGLDTFVLAESKTFLVFTDLAPLEAATLLEDLESMLARLSVPLGSPAAGALFPAKLVLIVCARSEDCATLETALFGNSSRAGSSAHCLAHGPRVTVLIHHDSGEQLFLARLARQLLIAALHLHGSPAPLPRWLSEGFADHLAAEVAPDSMLEVKLRTRGLEFIRAGGDPLSILEQTDDAARWTDLARADRGVSRLVCSLLIEQNPVGFARWIRSVKSGAPWHEALEVEYGATLEQVAHITREWHRLND